MDLIQHVSKGKKYFSSLTTTISKLSVAFNEMHCYKHLILTYLIIQAYRTNNIMQFMQIYQNKSFRITKLFTTTKQPNNNY